MNERFEFRYGVLPGDDQSLLSAVIFSFDRSNSISFRQLSKNIASLIPILPNMDGNSMQTTVDNKLLYDALIYLYPQILFCIISIKNNCQDESSIQINTYGKNQSICMKCVFIVHDIDEDIYKPLYLHDNEKNEEAKLNLRYDKSTLEMLQRFIKSEYKCK